MSNTDARMILEMGEDLVRLAKPVGPLFTATQQQARIDCWNGLRDICAFLRCHDCSGNLWSFESRAIQAELFQIVMDKFGKAFDRAYGKGCAIQMSLACVLASRVMVFTDSSLGMENCGGLAPRMAARMRSFGVHEMNHLCED